MRIISTIGDFHFRQDIPAALIELKIPGSLPQYAAESFAEVFYQQYETRPYSIWLSRFEPKEDQGIHIQREGPWIGLTVVLRRHIRYSSNVGEKYLKQGQFVVAHLPIPQIEANFRAKEGEQYLVFDLRLDPDFIKEMQIDKVLLWRFLEQIESGRQAFLTETTVNSSIWLLDTIAYLRQNPSDMAAVKRLVEYLIESAEHGRGADLPEYKIDRIYEARKIILQDIKRHLSNAQLARQVGTNARDLKTDFVKVFSIPPCQYLRYERIKAVKIWLVEEPRTTVEEIAIRAGFAGAAALDPSFRDSVGMTPLEWRKRGR